MTSVDSPNKTTITFGGSDETDYEGDLFVNSVVEELNNEWIILYSSSRYGGNKEEESLSNYAIVNSGNNLISITDPEWRAFANAISSANGDKIDCSSN